MLDSVRTTIRRHNLIQEGDKIVIGVSGGPDSVSLLHALHMLSDELKIELFAVHVNHMLRGLEADMDENYVIRLCSMFGINLHAVKINIAAIARQNKVSLEEAGREARYHEFNRYADIVGATKIAVAHNRNDQVETVLMHIIRGTGLDGLKGMEYKRHNIIRPLLDIDRSVIEEYCHVNKLDPRTDKTNLESIYTRNKLRLELIPMINNAFNIDITDNILRMSSLLKDDGSFIDSYVEDAYTKCIINEDIDSVRINGKILVRYHSAIIRRIVRNAVLKVKGDLKGIESVHIDEVLELCRNGRTGAVLHLPQGIRIGKSYDEIIVHTAKDCNIQAQYNEAIKMLGDTHVAAENFKIKACLEKPKNIKHYGNIGYNSLVQFFDYDKLKMGINIRNRRDGDIFKPLKSIGTKKLKEYFIDSKIPREARDQIPLVAKSNEIVWIIGYKISDKFKVTENTKRVLKLCFMELSNEGSY